MITTVQNDGGRLVVALMGELDHHAASGVLAEISARIDLALPRACVLDLSALNFMDSSGIAVVLKAYRQMRELGGTVAVKRVPPQPLRVLRAAGIDRLVPVEPLE